MAGQTGAGATNERIVRLLEEVKAQLADSKNREQQIAKEVPTPDGWEHLWREDRVDALLDRHDEGVLPSPAASQTRESSIRASTRSCS